MKDYKKLEEYNMTSNKRLTSEGNDVRRQIG